MRLKWYWWLLWECWHWRSLWDWSDIDDCCENVDTDDHYEIEVILMTTVRMMRMLALTTSMRLKWYWWLLWECRHWRSLWDWSDIDDCCENVDTDDQYEIEVILMTAVRMLTLTITMRLKWYWWLLWEWWECWHWRQVWDWSDIDDCCENVDTDDHYDIEVILMTAVRMLTLTITMRLKWYWWLLWECRHWRSLWDWSDIDDCCENVDTDDQYEIEVILMTAVRMLTLTTSMRSKWYWWLLWECWHWRSLWHWSDIDDCCENVDTDDHYEIEVILMTAVRMLTLTTSMRLKLYWSDAQTPDNVFLHSEINFSETIVEQLSSSHASGFNYIWLKTQIVSGFNYIWLKTQIACQVM